MALVETWINGHLFTFIKHSHIGITYYNVATALLQVTLILKDGAWTFLQSDTVPPEIRAVKDQLISTIEILEMKN